MEEDVKKIKDKIRNRILELLSAGADDEEIREEVEILGIDISTIDIQRIRVRWNEKVAADKEMLGSIEDLKDAPAVNYQEIMDANERWNRMMIHYECRRDFNMRDKARITNVMRSEHNRRRMEQRFM